MNEEQIKYMQAVNRQKWNTAPNRVVLIERLPDCYRLTTADRRVFHTDVAWGLKNHPIALCGREP
jgi:hypothetical protein